MAAPARTPSGVASHAGEGDEVDLVILTRDGGPPPGPVRAAVAAQAAVGLTLRLHVVAGTPLPGDANRWDTIARARNAGRSTGSAPFVMYLDDDVIPAPGCLARLVDGLKRSPAHAAFAVDLLGETDPTGFGLPSRHVGMGAVMFRREVLAFLRFRWEPGKCECRCCADDLRRAGFGIDYLPGGAGGLHRPDLTAGARRAGSHVAPPPSPARILTALNRDHLARFRRLFLASLRASGNSEPVSAVAYGLTPSEQRALARVPGVEAVALPNNGVNPAIRRLFDFQPIVARLPADTPVAHWDAGDVVFQAPLRPLWDLARAHPDRLLAVCEPVPFLRNAVATEWVLTVSDRASSRTAFHRLATSPYLNGGFAAGTARAFLAYLRETHRLRHSRATAGTTDWSDQTAMNLYCHTDPSRWLAVSEGWNYCLCGRDRASYRVSPAGRVADGVGTPVHAVHGNARSMRWFELSHVATE